VCREFLFWSNKCAAVEKRLATTALESTDEMFIMLFSVICCKKSRWLSWLSIRRVKADLVQIVLFVILRERLIIMSRICLILSKNYQSMLFPLQLFVVIWNYKVANKFIVNYMMKLIYNWWIKMHPHFRKEKWDDI